MKYKKVNRIWNYKTFDLAEIRGDNFLEELGKILDEAGKNGWELAYMNERFMILKQLYIIED